jgi:exodeoxyribonuclease V alpha subunit
MSKTHPENNDILGRLHAREEISHLDYYFAAYMARVFSHEDPLIKISCALVSSALARGQVCLDLKAMAGQVIASSEKEGAIVRLPELATWTNVLTAAPMVGKSEDEATCRMPLVLDREDGCLYLSKYYDFQERLVQDLTSRLRCRPRPLDPAFVGSQIEQHFSRGDREQTHPQRQAVETALHSCFTVISGGPGTGKTHITRIIREILEAHAHARHLPFPRFLSLAPTGRAASRLQEGATIHSVLIPRKDRPGFVHGKHNPLAADVVIIDEASMIDLALMTRLMEAIPLSARVILLGDDNQLSPVQAGAVFSEICRAETIAPVKVSLTHNFRSRGKTGIEHLANAIRNSDVEQTTRVLTRGSFPDLVFEPPGEDRSQVLEAYIQSGYGPLMRQQGLTGALEAMDRFRILCAHNVGEFGTLQINHVCEKVLRGKTHSAITDRSVKQMVMIRTNDYDRGLFNGDTGVVVQEKENLVAGFRMEDGMIRRFGYMDLPSHEPAFGMTIHKSQGSEFDTVLILIPDQVSRVVTRQLLYTGVTRAKTKAVILGPLPVIQAAMSQPPVRTCRIAGRLAREKDLSAPDIAMEG